MPGSKAPGRRKQGNGKGHEVGASKAKRKRASGERFNTSRELPDATILRMQVRLLAFASAAQAIGAGACDWQLAGASTVRDLRLRLAIDFPAIAPLLPRLAIAVNGTLASPETPVGEGAEVALLPPVSGG